jgi:hypothetical protein
VLLLPTQPDTLGALGRAFATRVAPTGDLVRLPCSSLRCTHHLKAQPTSYPRTRVSCGTVVLLDSRLRGNDEARNCVALRARLRDTRPLLRGGLAPLPRGRNR